MMDCGDATTLMLWVGCMGGIIVGFLIGSMREKTIPAETRKTNEDLVSTIRALTCALQKATELFDDDGIDDDGIHDDGDDGGSRHEGGDEDPIHQHRD